MSIFSREDKAARFEQAVMPYERGIYLLCLRMVSHPEDAKDCAQEALLKAYRGFDRFRGTATVKTWLYRIAANTCIDFLRARRDSLSLDTLSEGGFEPVDTAPTPEGQALAHEQQEALKNALSLLSDDRRAVVILHDFQDMPYRDIARILRIREGTVKSRLSRAREQLKEIFKTTEQMSQTHVKEDEGRQRP